MKAGTITAARVEQAESDAATEAKAERAMEELRRHVESMGGTFEPPIKGLRWECCVNGLPVIVRPWHGRKWFDSRYVGLVEVVYTGRGPRVDRKKEITYVERKTKGIDWPLLVERILVAADEARVAREARLGAEANKQTWAKIADQLRADFPDAPALISATPTGLKIRTSHEVSETVARRVLAALIVKGRGRG